MVISGNQFRSVLCGLTYRQLLESFLQNDWVQTAFKYFMVKNALWSNYKRKIAERKSVSA